MEINTSTIVTLNEGDIKLAIKQFLMSKDLIEGRELREEEIYLQTKSGEIHFDIVSVIKF